MSEVVQRMRAAGMSEEDCAEAALAFTVLEAAQLASRSAVDRSAATTSSPQPKAPFTASVNIPASANKQLEQHRARRRQLVFTGFCPDDRPVFELAASYRASGKEINLRRCVEAAYKHLGVQHTETDFNRVYQQLYSKLRNMGVAKSR